MEPGRAIENLLPIEGIDRSLGDAGIRAVINDLGRTLVGAGLQEIDAHAAIHHLDVGNVHAEAADVAQASLADRVVRQSGNESSIHAVVGKGNSHVRLAAAKGGFKGRALEEALQRGALQTEHDLTESNNTSHCQSLLNLYLSRHGKEKRALTHFLTLLYTMRMCKSRHQTNKERNLPI